MTSDATWPNSISPASITKVPMMMGTSRAIIAWYCKRPKPWISNTVSTSNEPPMKISNKLPKLVATGIIELRNAWPNTARLKLTPLATAVRT